LDVHAAVTVPNLDTGTPRMRRENVLAPSLSLGVIGALDYFHCCDVAGGIQEIAPVRMHQANSSPFSRIVRVQREFVCPL